MEIQEGEAVVEVAEDHLKVATTISTTPLATVEEEAIIKGQDPNAKFLAKMDTQLSSYHRFDHSYQDEDTNFAGVATTTSYQVDPNWYMDSGATDHITSDLDRLTIKDKYGGGDQVQVGNGLGTSNEEKTLSRQM